MFGAAQLNSFINFLNAASSFYRDDIKLNLNYVQSNMAAAYGKSSQFYGVAI
jgi:hypothetical protein